MDRIRTEIRATLHESFFTKEVDSTAAFEKFFALPILLTGRFIWRLEVYAIGAVIPTCLLFAVLVNAWIPVNAWTVGLTGAMLLGCACSFAMCAYIQERVGYWALSTKDKPINDQKKRTREWRFIPASGSGATKRIPAGA